MSLVTLIHKYINNDSTGDIPNSLQHLVCVTDCILLFYFSFSVRQSVFVSPKIKNLFSVIQIIQHINWILCNLIKISRRSSVQA